MRDDHLHPSKEQQGKQFRDIDMDIMRIIAAFFVVLIHASSFNSVSAVFYNSISRFSAPVFILISGSYTLNKPINGKRLFQKCIKLFLIMIAWSAVYFIFGCVSGELMYKGRAALITYLLTQPIHLWFLYALIGLYIFSPLLYTFCAHASRSEYIYVIVLTFLFGSVITITLRTECLPILSIIVAKMQIDTQLGFVFLYITAAFIRKFDVRLKIPYSCLIFAAAISLSFLGTLLVRRFEGAPGDLLLSFFAPNALIGGVGFYLLIKALYNGRPSKILKASNNIAIAASSTFGVYLMHPLVIKVLDIMLFSRTGFQLDSFLLIPVRATTAFLVSFSSISIMKFITLKLRRT